MAAVTIAALACGAALLAAEKREELVIASPSVRAVGVVGALALVAVSFVGVVGSSALAASERALDKGRYDEARSQADKAERWWPWSPDPWRQLGDTQTELGDAAAARVSYRKAISKDDGDWKLWYDLSSVSDGAESRRALAEAIRRNRYAADDTSEEPSSVSR
jgi:tetratricopeptide (TPR) repeat protein